MWQLLLVSFFCLLLLTPGTMFITKKSWAGPASAFAAIVWWYVFQNGPSLLSWQAWVFGMLPALLGAVVGYRLGLPVLRRAIANERNYPKEKDPARRAKAQKRS